MGTLFFVIILVIVLAIIVSNQMGKGKERKQDEPKKIEEQKPKQDTQELLADVYRHVALAELLKQAQENGDEDTCKLILANKYEGPLPEKIGDGWTNIYNEFEISIAGINYRENIEKYLGTCEVKLEPDPTNEYDPDAIKIVAADGGHLGFVPKDKTEEVRKRVSLPASGIAVISKGDSGEILDDEENPEYFYGKVRIKSRS